VPRKVRVATLSPERGARTYERQSFDRYGVGMSVAAQTSDHEASMTEYVEDRMDRAKQKVRSVGKQQVPKNSELSDDDSRIKKMEADMIKLSADMKELMQLIIRSQQSVQNWNGQRVQQGSQCLAQPPVTGNFTQFSQQGTQLQC